MLKYIIHFELTHNCPPVRTFPGCHCKRSIGIFDVPDDYVCSEESTLYEYIVHMPGLLSVVLLTLNWGYGETGKGA